MTQEILSTDLKSVMRRLKLGPISDTLPERLTLARSQQMTHQDFLLLVLSDEASRRDNQSMTLRIARAQLDPEMQLDRWDSTAKVTFDRTLLNEIVSLRFLEAHAHVTLVGPVGVGKTFLAHALGHIACRRNHSVLVLRTDRMLKTLKHSRLDNSLETEMRRLMAVDLLILDDFGLDPMDVTESRDIYEILVERHRAGSMIVTSNRGPDEWVATFADPVRAQSAIDRFTNNSYDLVIDGESYRPRLKPRLNPVPLPTTPAKGPSAIPQTRPEETPMTQRAMDLWTQARSTMDGSVDGATRRPPTRPQPRQLGPDSTASTAPTTRFLFCAKNNPKKGERYPRITHASSCNRVGECS